MQLNAWPGKLSLHGHVYIFTLSLPENYDVNHCFYATCFKSKLFLFLIIVFLYSKMYCSTCDVINCSIYAVINAPF